MTRNLVVVGVVMVLAVSGVVGLLSSDPGRDAVADAVPTVVVQPTSTPEPTPTATPAPPDNREDCAEIRGTDYLSREERQWFLSNCVSN